MDVVIERCAGLDVHKANVVACVKIAGQKGEGEVRTFGTMTHDLEALRDWLLSERVTHVAMESTGVYWKPIWNVLEERFELLLCNAKQVKRPSKQKTDVKDCQWIARLLQHGLLNGSFVPSREQRELRDLTRYRVKLAGQHTAEVNRIQKILEDANIKLGDVASDVMGASGRDMLRAMIEGETDPKKLAELARRRLRGKIPDLRRALAGKLTDHHRFILGMHFDAVLAVEASIAKLDSRISEITGQRPTPPSGGGGSDTPLFDPAPVASPSMTEPPSAGGEPPLSTAKAIELVATIPGVSKNLAECIIAEIGTDMRRFPSSSALASWAGMCPGNNESAGVKRSGRAKKGSAWLRRALGIAAVCSARQTNCFLASRYRRKSKQRGKSRAVVATGHAILRIIYFMLSARQAYTELGADFYDRQNTARQIRYHERRAQELKALSTATPATPAA